MGLGPGTLAGPEAALCTKTPRGPVAAWTPVMPGDWLAAAAGPVSVGALQGSWGWVSFLFIQYV